MKLDRIEKGPLTRQSQTDPLKITYAQSIPQNSHYAPYGINSFSGLVKDFRLYLKLMEKFIKANEEVKT